MTQQQKIIRNLGKHINDTRDTPQYQLGYIHGASFMLRQLWLEGMVDYELYMKIEDDVDRLKYKHFPILES